MDIDDEQVSARVIGDNGATDIALSTATPAQRAHRSSDLVSTLTSYTTIGGAWHSTVSQTNVLAAGTSYVPRGADLVLGSGRMSDDVRSLKPIATIQLDVVTEGQMALHMPVPTSVTR